MSRRSRQADPSRAPELDRLERWMLEVVSHPDGASAGVRTESAGRHLPVSAERLEDVVEPSKALSATERLEIYAGMYYWRMIDVLAEDFRAVRRVLGDERFAEIARAYIDAHPSTHYSLSMLGRALPQFLRESEAPVSHREFVADLAALERSIEEVFDAPGAPKLETDDLLAVPRDRWSELRFDMIPAFRLHAFTYPVNDYYQAFREERDAAVPGPDRTWLAVFRRELKVWRMPLTRPQYAILESLGRGLPLAAALESAADLPGVDPGELVESLREWFAAWAGEGLFAGLR